MVGTKAKRTESRYAAYLPTGPSSSQYVRGIAKEERDGLGGLGFGSQSLRGTNNPEFHPNLNIATAPYGVDLDFGNQVHKLDRLARCGFVRGTDRHSQGRAHSLRRWKQSHLPDARLTWSACESIRFHREYCHQVCTIMGYVPDLS